jgi:hypothetical protein
LILFQFFSQESETLVSQNHSLKSEIHKLEKEKKRLMNVLLVHETSCAKRLKPTPTNDTYNNDSYEMLDDSLQDSAAYPHKLVEPPSFADYTSLPSIKVEDMSSPVDENIFLRPPEPLSYYDGSAFQTHRLYNNHVPASHHFLGVKTLGHSYLDLDSRCIAL